MDLQLRPLTINLAALNGLSEKLILSHHANNYTGAVKRLDAIRQQLAHLDWPTAPVFMINGLKREELIAVCEEYLLRRLAEAEQELRNEAEDDSGADVVEDDEDFED